MLSQISEQIQKGKAKVVKQLVQEAIDAGVPAQEILEKGLIAGMNVVGESSGSVIRKNFVMPLAPSISAAS